ncbi:WXG100-like domain-containing protein [Nocardia sp. NPDC004722]
MPIEIPHEVALLLNYAGVPYPDIDEDQIRELATHVLRFVARVRDTHDAATDAINDMGAVYSGYSYEQLLTAWARTSVTHMNALDQGCKVVAAALNVAADVIAAAKVAVLAELTALAISYVAAMSATVATAGLSAAIAQTCAAAARKLISVLGMAIVDYLFSEVIGKALEPLEHTIENMTNGALHDVAADLLAPPSSSAALPLMIDPDAVLRYADLLDQYGDDIRQHAADFAEQVGGLNFTTGTAPDPGIATTPTFPSGNHTAPTPRVLGTANPATLSAGPMWLAAHPLDLPPVQPAAGPVSASETTPVPSVLSSTVASTPRSEISPAPGDRASTRELGQPAGHGSAADAQPPGLSYLGPGSAAVTGPPSSDAPTAPRSTAAAPWGRRAFDSPELGPSTAAAPTDRPVHHGPEPAAPANGNSSPPEARAPLLGSQPSVAEPPVVQQNPTISDPPGALPAAPGSVRAVGRRDPWARQGGRVNPRITPNPTEREVTVVTPWSELPGRGDRRTRVSPPPKPSRHRPVDASTEDAPAEANPSGGRGVAAVPSDAGSDRHAASQQK